MPYQTTHCNICGSDPYKPSTKHPEVCKKCESDVHFCILSNTKITDNGQPYSFITTKPQHDEISKQLGRSRDYEFKPNQNVNQILEITKNSPEGKYPTNNKIVELFDIYIPNW